jgi:hypothetical protein
VSERKQKAASIGSLFAGGYFDGGSIRLEHRSETPLRLAYGLIDEAPNQVQALALSLRDIADQDEHAPDEPLSKRQNEALDALLETQSSELLRMLVREAKPTLSRRRDLYAFAAIVLNASRQLPVVRRARADAEVIRSSFDGDE